MMLTFMAYGRRNHEVTKGHEAYAFSS